MNAYASNRVSADEWSSWRQGSRLASDQRPAGIRAFRDTWLRGLITLVNTMDGPQNTSSSSTTPCVDRHVVLNLHVVADDHLR